MYILWSYNNSAGHLLNRLYVNFDHLVNAWLKEYLKLYNYIPVCKQKINKLITKEIQILDARIWLSRSFLRIKSSWWRNVAVHKTMRLYEEHSTDLSAVYLSSIILWNHSTGYTCISCSFKPWTHTCMYYMYVCTYVHTRVCRPICMYTCMYIVTHAGNHILEQYADIRSHQQQILVS